MKLLTAEDEAKFYHATVKEGTIGGLIGLAVGSVGVYGASKRYSLIRNLTLPFKVFLAVSTGSFAAIICADRGGRAYEKTNHPDRHYHDERQALLEKLHAERTQTERALYWANENRYSIVAGSWVASMATAFALVSRSPMSTPQKLVQARVYAQGLTMAVVIASLALEGADMKAARSGNVDVTGAIKQKRLSDKDQWMDMVEAEEERMREKEVRKGVRAA